MPKKQKKRQLIQRTLRVAIIKPLNCTWDQAGNALRYAKNACIASSNLTTSLLLRADDAFSTVALDKQGLQLPEKKGKLNLPSVKDVEAAAYHFVRSKFPCLSSRVMNYVVRDAKARYETLRLRMISGRVTAPTYRNPSIGSEAIIKKENGDFTLDFTLLSRANDIDCPSRVRFLIHTSKLRGQDRDILNELATGQRKCGRVSICHLPRKKKWAVHIPHEREAIQHTPVKDRVMYVHPPGQQKFLRCSCWTKTNEFMSETTKAEDHWHEDLEYESVLRTRKQSHDKAVSISRKYRQDGNTSACGHGRKRALKNKEKYQAKYRRACRTFNQQRAAHAVRLALRWKCDIIRFQSPADIELEGFQFADSWPWYEFEECLKNKAEENSIKFEKIDESTSKAWVEAAMEPVPPGN